MWKKRSGELSYCTTQTALPTLNQHHSSPVHPAFPLLFLPVQEDSYCCSPHPLQMYRPAVAVKVGTGTLTGTMETAHTHKTQGAVTSSDCGSWWKTWMNTQMNTWTEEWIKDRRGWDRGREEWQDKRQETRCRKKMCSKQMSVTALGSSLYTSARGGKSNDKISFLGN